MGSDDIPSQMEHIFRSKLPDIDIPTHLPLHSFLFQNSLPDHRNKTCLINGPTGQTYTYGEVELNARRVAAGLNKLGVRRRDVIMLLLPNCPEFVFAFLGASFRGVTITTANPFYTAGEIEKQVKSSKTRLIVTQSAYIEKLRGLMAGQDDQHEGVMIICTDDQVPEGCMHVSVLTGADESDIPEVEIVPEEDVAVLPYSSGTTGLPKGVMLTHRGLVTSIAQHVDGENPSIYINKHDVLLCVLPMFHIFAMGVAFLNGLRRGATVLLVPKFDVVTVMDLIQRYKVSVAPFVPPVVLAIAKSPEAPKYDLTSVRIVYTGGAPMGKELEDAFRAVVTNAKLGQGYGMTEACPLAICLAFAKESSDSKSGSCGTVVRNAEMKIVDTITGESLPRNKSGEICIRGGQIMKGYLNNPEATKQTIDADGWLHTGDIGYIDDDEEIFIVDRLKELIKYKGFQVAPAELEDLLKAHSAITDAAVIPMKDEAAGEIPVAFVVRSSGSTVTVEEIKKYIAKEVVFYKKIHKVFFLETIPKSPSGKILRKNLRANLAAGHYIEGQMHPSS